MIESDGFAIVKMGIAMSKMWVAVTEEGRCSDGRGVVDVLTHCVKESGC